MLQTAITCMDAPLILLFLVLPRHGSGWASIFDYNQGELRECEIEFRQDWCKQQIELIGEFGAVLGGGV